MLAYLLISFDWPLHAVGTGYWLRRLLLERAEEASETSDRAEEMGVKMWLEGVATVCTGQRCWISRDAAI